MRPPTATLLLRILSDLSQLEVFVRVVDAGSFTAAAVYAVYPHHRHLSAKVRLFLDELLERFADPPWPDLVTQ